MNEALLKTFSDRVRGLCDEMGIDAAFFVFSVGREIYGATVKATDRPATVQTDVIEMLQKSIIGALGGAGPSITLS